jgi:hypothetical protein
LIFQRRRDGLWLGKTAMVVVAAFFVLGSFLSWFSWTQIARPKVFHVPTYNPPLTSVAIATAVIAALIFCALGPFRRSLAQPAASLKPAAPWLTGAAAFMWATLWYGLVLLAFGIAPQFPPAIAVGAGILLSVTILFLLPRWAAHAGWSDTHQFATIFGAMLGMMLSSFIGFIGNLSLDLYFKIGVDALAVLLMIALGARLKIYDLGIRI